MLRLTRGSDVRADNYSVRRCGSIVSVYVTWADVIYRREQGETDMDEKPNATCSNARAQILVTVHYICGYEIYNILC